MTSAQQTQQTQVVGRLSNVDKWYGTRRVLDGISLQIHTSEIVALVGRSGCGKSTVLRVLAGLSADHTGTREVAGAPAVAFQEPRLFPWRDVLTNVTYGRNRTNLSNSAAVNRSEQALAEIGLADHAKAWPLTLSGGQAQRVSPGTGGRAAALAARRAVRGARCAHANVLEHLADAEVKPKDVKLIFLQPADALSAFANGQGDAWVI